MISVEGFAFLQCGQMFWQRHLSFSMDIAKINFVIGLMRDKASAWVEAMNSNFDVKPVDL